MKRLVAIWEHYWFKLAPLFDLAIVRIFTVSFQLLIFTILRNKSDSAARLVNLPDAFYQPGLFLRLLSQPFGSNFRPDSQEIEFVYWVVVAFGILALIGFVTNLSLLVFMLGNTFFNAFIYSFGEFHHPEAIMMIALVILTLSPCGRVLSVDAYINQRRIKRSDQPEKRIPILELKSIYASWPLLLIQWMYGLIYLSSAVAKLYRSRMDWVNGYTIQFNLLDSGVRPVTPFGLWLGQQHDLAILLSWVTLMFEGTFWLVPLFPRLAWIYIPVGIGTHLGIYLAMGPDFYEFLGLYVVFIPWTKVFSALSRFFSRWLSSLRTPVQPDVVEPS